MRDDHEKSDNETRARRRSRLRRAGPAAAALACLILLAACSAGSKNPVTDAGRTGSSGGSTLAYSQCMRSHGITHFPDPDSQGGLSVSGGPGSGLDPNSPQFKAADQACRKLLPSTNLSPAQQAANEARALRYSECMRSHGIADYPDPNSQGALSIRATPGSDLDPNNPLNQAAVKACQHIMPGGKGGSLHTSGGSQGGGS